MTDQQLSDVTLPPAHERQGDHGHDNAMVRANAVQLLAWRAAGLTYDQLAERAGYADGAGARNALIRALDRHEAEKVTELRQLENIRLDAVVRAATTIMVDPSKTPNERMRAADTITRASARRSRLNGLDAPVQVAISAGVRAELNDALTEIAEVLELTADADGVYAIEDEPAG